MKQIIANNGFENKEAVISIPPYLTQSERKAVLAAAKIAELNVKLINESTAVALDYGMFRKSELTNDPRNVLFIDFGHSKLSIFCSSFTKEEMNILYQDYERNIGCRDLDYLMYDQFYRPHFEKVSGGLDLAENRKAYIKLMENIERQRKILSGNLEFDMNIEYLMEEEDLRYTMKREEFIAVSAPVFEKIRDLILAAREALKDKGINLHSVELVGGGTRIPEFLRIVKEIFGQ